MNKRQQAEARQLTDLIRNRRAVARAAAEMNSTDIAAYYNHLARQYLFDLIRLTRYKSAINPVNEAY